MLGKIVIIDKDIEFAERLKHKIAKHYKNENVYVFNEYPVLFLENNKIDLLFIEQKFDILFVDMLRKHKHDDMQIIITTDRNEIVYDAVSWFPIYDCKKTDLDWELKRIFNKLASTHFREEIKLGDTSIRVNCILYAKQIKGSIVCYLLDGSTLEGYITIEKLESYNFIRCNRSMLINPYFIRNEIKRVITMKNETKIKISRIYYNSFKKKIRKYILDTA